MYAGWCLGANHVGGGQADGHTIKVTKGRMDGRADRQCSLCQQNQKRGEICNRLTILLANPTPTDQYIHPVPYPTLSTVHSSAQLISLQFSINHGEKSNAINN